MKNKDRKISMAEEFQLLPFLGIENGSGDPNSTIPLTFRDRQVNDQKASVAYSNYQYNSHVARELKANEKAEAGPAKKVKTNFQATGYRKAPTMDDGKSPRTNFWFAGGNGLESRSEEENNFKSRGHMEMQQDYHMSTGGMRSVGGVTTDVTRAGSDAWGTHSADRLGQGMTTVTTHNHSFKGTMNNGMLSGPSRGVGPVGTARDNEPHQILRLRQAPPSPQEVAARRQNQHDFPVPQSIINASTGPMSSVTESHEYDGNPRWYASRGADPQQVPFKRAPYAEHYVPIVANDGSLVEQGVHKDRNGFERGRGGVDQQWQQQRLDAATVNTQVDGVIHSQKKEQQQKYAEVLEEQMRIKKFQARQERNLETQLGFDSVQPVRVIDRSGGTSMGTVRNLGIDGTQTRQFDANRGGIVNGGTSTLVEFGPKNDYITTIDHVQKNGKYHRPPWVTDTMGGR